MWVSLRLKTLGPVLSSCLENHQSGGTTFQLEFPDQDWQFAACLDYAKAFDSADVSLCLELLSKIGFPEQVLALTRDQWCSHKRWLSFAGATAKEPLLHAEGLPQGDPFAPICLSLLLALPARHVASVANDSKTLLYIDDRTLTAKSIPQLCLAHDTWQEFEQCTRMRTHPEKTQWIGRTLRLSLRFVTMASRLRPLVACWVSLLAPVVKACPKKEKARLDNCCRMADRLAPPP